MASNTSPLSFVSGEYFPVAGTVVLYADRAMTPGSGYAGGAWRVRFGNHSRAVTGVTVLEYSVELSTAASDPDLGPDEVDYLATPAEIVDADGLVVRAQGPIAITPA